MTIIQDNQIAFRPTTEADLSLVLSLESDNDNAPYIRLWPLDQHRSAIADANIAHFIVLTIPDKKIIGYIILVGLENPDRSIEFKRIVITNKGAGLGRAALQLIKRYVFEIRGAHRLWLEVMEHNERTYQLYKSDGFVLEGVHREALKQADEFVSLKVMSILAGEYTHEDRVGQDP